MFDADRFRMHGRRFTDALNAEAVLDLTPTLVLGTPMAGPPEVLDQLRQAGVEVRIFEDLNGLDAPQIKT